ncbi:MAG: diaminopimelate epimerase, partial [Planctomycetes bacterium]|nr:diaminopimelate epimerase [Planctomycetota bacterium]
TGAGVVHAKIIEAGNVRVQLTNPGDIQIGGNISLNTYNRGAKTNFDFINTGVPHVVVDVGDEDVLSKLNIKSVGSEIRYHTQFQPAGTNVNFVSYAANGGLKTRTYERGVEGETLACGTGAVATAVLSHMKGKASSPVIIVPTSGIPLVVHFKAEGMDISEVALEGDARLIYKGYFNPEALD